MPEQPTHSTDVVYGELGDALVLIPRDRAEELADVRRAVQRSTTWGELRARLSEERRDQIAENFGDEDVPADDVTLDDVRVPGWDDGDWPEWPAQAMLDWVPAEVQALGTEGSTRLNGEQLELDPERTADVVAAMETAGYAMTRDDAAVEGASWG
jgi:hypothetical protein